MTNANGILKTVFLSLILFSILFLSSLPAENNVSSFEQNWAVNFFLNYNMGVYSDLKSSQYETDIPWNVGLGLRYRSLSAQVSASVPIKWQWKDWFYDLNLSSYFEKIYFEAYFKHYPNMIQQNNLAHNELDIYSSGIMATFVNNGENHSLSSVIKMDEKQNASSGSLLFGLGLFHTALYSPTKSVDRYDNRQHLLYCGPGIGYSYIWVFDNGMFLNIGMLLYANLALNVNTGNGMLIPQIEPRIVIGHHDSKWSINLNMMNYAAFIVWSKNNTDALALVNVKIMFSKRF